MCGCDYERKSWCQRECLCNSGGVGTSVSVRVAYLGLSVGRYIDVCEFLQSHEPVSCICIRAHLRARVRVSVLTSVFGLLGSRASSFRV